MIRYFIIMLCFISNLHAQDINYEKIATQYFFEHIFKNKYSNINVLEYDGVTKNILTSFYFFGECFDRKDSIKLLLAEKSLDKEFRTKSVDLPNYSEIKFKKKNLKSRKRFKLNIYLANEVNNKVYVLIELYKRDSHSDAYMLEMNKNGEVLRWCKTGLMY